MQIISGTRAGPEKRLNNGKVKRAGENQDALAVRQLDDGCVLMAVMDGISNDPYGRLIATWLADRFKNAPLFVSVDDPLTLKLAIESLLYRMLNDEECAFCADSGCTVTFAIVEPESGKGCVAWAGDSPAFITRKDSDEGTELLTRAHADPAGLLTSVFTGRMEMIVDTAVFQLEDGDVLTLMTDGVGGEKDGLFFLDTVYRETPFSDVEELLLSRGAVREDDATFIAFRMEDAGQ